MDKLVFESRGFISSLMNSSLSEHIQGGGSKNTCDKNGCCHIRRSGYEFDIEILGEGGYTLYFCSSECQNDVYESKNY